MDNVHVGAPARTQVTCSKCGKATTVPFTPTPGRPVFCRECFASAPPRAAPSRMGGPVSRDSKPNVMPRKRMMAQGRKGHFLYDAQALLNRSEGGMDEQHQRAFLEGLFARGARTSTDAAQEFLEEKVTDLTITKQQRDGLGQLVDRYSFWR
jgi:CxxC-x17-CxxC domain-containing protein